MASEEDIARLRRMIDDPAGSTATYQNSELEALLDSSEGNFEAVASDLWREKAAGYARLVDVVESGSQRKMGSLHKNALEMAKFYGDALVVPEEDLEKRPVVRRIERA